MFKDIFFFQFEVTTVFLVVYLFSISAFHNMFVCYDMKHSGGS